MSAGLVAMAPAGTWVARLDAQVKFAFLLVASTLIFAWNSIALQFGLLLAVLALMAAARVPPATMRRLLALVLPAIVLVTMIQGAFSPLGQTPVWIIPPTVPWVGGAPLATVEGLVFGLVVGCRLLVPLLAFQLVFMTTEPNEIVLGLVRIGLPYRVAFLVSTTFRFVPLLLNEFQTIQEVQRLRGVDLDSMGLPRRLVALGRTVVPLMITSLTRAQVLEVALQARGFTGSADRTALHPGREALTGAERAIVAGLAFLLTGAVLGRVGLGWGGEVL